MVINGDCLEELKKLPDNSVDSVVSDPPYGISFMGKKWDYDVPRVEVWQEVLRVLKPGGHALVACGTRTQHRMAVNLEDAGFEIRDIVAWVYGSGFPKSLNIGKAVDKLQGNEREEVGIYKSPEGTSGKSDGSGSNFGIGGLNMQTKGTSEWEGWGTALKPAMELWTLCRKPLEEKTVAENVLRWGTGGINIDGSRIGTETRTYGGMSANKPDVGTFRDDNWKPKDIEVTVNGRFPANLIHDGSDEVVSGFPNNAQRFYYTAKASKSERNKGLEGFEEKRDTDRDNDSIELANRLHNKTNLKNFHPTVKPVSLMRYLCRLITPKNGTVLDPFMGSGSTGIGAKLEGFQFIGMELDPEYTKIAEARIEAWQPEPQQTMI